MTTEQRRKPTSNVRSVWENFLQKFSLCFNKCKRADFVMRYWFLWHKRFKERREDVEDDSRCGRPSTSRNEAKVDLVKKMVRGDCRLTERLISDELRLN